MEGEEVDQAAGGCQGQRHQHDFPDHSCVVIAGLLQPNPLLTMLCHPAPKDQVSRAAKMLAEEYVRALSHC